MRTDRWLLEVGVGKIGDGGQNVQTFSYETSAESVMYHIVTG